MKIKILTCLIGTSLFMQSVLAHAFDPTKFVCHFKNRTNKSFALSLNTSLKALGPVATNNIQRMYIQPNDGWKILQIPITHMQLNDGLSFSYNLLDLSGIGAILAQPPTLSFDNKSETAHYAGYNFLVAQLHSNSGRLINLITYSSYSSSPTYSTEHYYSPANNATFFAPNGTSYEMNWTSDSSFDQTITSPHHHSKITYHYSYVGSNKATNVSPHDEVCSGSNTYFITDGNWGYPENGSYYVLSSITLSNGYTLNFGYVNLQFSFNLLTNFCLGGNPSCTQFILSNISDNHGRNWHFDVSTNGNITQMTFPNGNVITGLLDGLPTSSMPPLKDINGLTYSGLDSSTLTYSGANLATSETENMSWNGTTQSVLTHTNGSKDLYTYINNKYKKMIGKGDYSSHIIQNKSGATIFDEENTWGWIGNTSIGVPILLKQTITQDGISTSKTFNQFNQFLYPQTIARTASNGATTTTKSTYKILQATSTHGHMVLPSTVTVTNGSGHVVRSIVNYYSGDGYLTSSVIDGVSTEYTYDTEGNIASRRDASGNITKYSDYVSGKPRTVTDANGNNTWYKYDYRGLPLQISNTWDIITNYTYDTMGRVLSVTPIAHTPVNPITYSYSQSGLLQTRTRGESVTRATYDGFGRMVTKVITDGNSNDTVALLNKYNSLTNQRFSSYPSRSLTQCRVGNVCTYDVLGRPISLIKNTTSPF